MFIFDFCLIFHEQIHTLLSITEKIKHCSASDAELSSRSSSKNNQNIKNKRNRKFLSQFLLQQKLDYMKRTNHSTGQDVNLKGFSGLDLFLTKSMSVTNFIDSVIFRILLFPVAQPP